MTRHARTLVPTAVASDMSVTARRTASITHSLSELEFDRDFHDDVDRRSEATCRRESPLPHGLHGAFVETGAKPLHDLHVADRSILLHDDLENHFAFDPSRRASSV